MTFREQLNKVNELGINICDLAIANECDCVFGFKYSDKQFEKLCSLARQVYLKSEYITENAIARTINDYITQDGKTISQVLATNIWTILGKASLYC